MASPLHSQIINWGGLFGSTIVDRSGQALDDSFTFQLGYFDNGFVPASDNLRDWQSNWVLFDEAGYNATFGYFTGSASIDPDGDDLSIFSGQQAYLWVFNSQIPNRIDDNPLTEWFLATDEDWTFPDPIVGCCDGALPLEWSMSDLDSADVTPVWGSQTGQIGKGSYDTTSSSYHLQTFGAAIPEAGPVVVFVMVLGLALTHRRRNPVMTGSR